MTKEIKKETDWLGREKDVIYENGKKVGEIRHEKTLFGKPVDRVYNKNGDCISEIRQEKTIWGTSKEVTYEPGIFGNKISETKYEKDVFGRKKGVIYENGRKIGELKTEKGIFGGRKQVLREYGGHDVDLTKRAVRKNSSARNIGDCGEESYYLQNEASSQAPDRKLRIYKHTNREAIKKSLETGFYTGVIFEPPTYEVKYRCDRCGHEHYSIYNNYRVIPEFEKCRMGCSDVVSLSGLVRIIVSLFTGKPAFGYARLISQKELY
ncbi:MAG: hypothetical protein QXL88_01550 [Candidatus Pacearchaeota archaeon]